MSGEIQPSPRWRIFLRTPGNHGKEDDTDPPGIDRLCRIGFIRVELHALIRLAHDKVFRMAYLWGDIWQAPASLRKHSGFPRILEFVN